MEGTFSSSDLESAARFSEITEEDNTTLLSDTQRWDGVSRANTPLSTQAVPKLGKGRMRIGKSWAKKQNRETPRGFVNG